MYERYTRPLTENERRRLAARIEEFERQARPALSIVLRQACIGFGIAAFICMLGYAASANKPPAGFIALIFLLPGTVWTVWFSSDALKQQRWAGSAVGGLRDALAGGKARVERVRAQRMVEIEEREDEGACYLFEVEPQRLLVLFGQEYYASESFPSTDFSLIDILDSRGNPVDCALESAGQPLMPCRRVSATDALKDLVPCDERFLDCGIDELEAFLRARLRRSGA